ncbi:MAG: hypothetical protein K0R09_3927 [Clostridiales bacterium]|jgi:EAL domain-containing protein (putative c-di-GMP-specific phosphodiesterase class I)|nr:hypothetical protein [Clostridiales bacterium]
MQFCLFYFYGGVKVQASQKIESKYKHSITHWFQPIYHLKNYNVLGYEALLRDASLMNSTPVELFKEADKTGERNVLDLISLKEALEKFRHQSCTLFLNVFPSTLLENDFLPWWDTHVPLNMDIVLELLESEPICNWDEIRTITNELKSRGVKIAIDDMGQGYSFLQQWVELEPDFIKLDRYFAENLSVNSRKQKIVENLVDLLSDSTEIIIEGIETEKDLNIAELLGISYAQGYLLGKPTPIQDF